MSFGDDFILTAITNDPKVAKAADEAGINCVGLDFEVLGKRKRQPNSNQWVSDHRVDQIKAVRDSLSEAKLFARTNPLNERSHEEIETLLEEGVEVLMLPMFGTAQEVQVFVDMVAGRAEISLLAETIEALHNAQSICQINGIDEMNAGLNDLHLAYGYKSHFEILTKETFEKFANQVHKAHITFGFGTIGRLSNDNLPIPPDLIIAQYPRLGATSARLFRHFLGPDPLSLDMPSEVQRIRDRLTFWSKQSEDALEAAKRQLAEACAQF